MNGPIKWVLLFSFTPEKIETQRLSHGSWEKNLALSHSKVYAFHYYDIQPPEVASIFSTSTNFIQS